MNAPKLHSPGATMLLFGVGLFLILMTKWNFVFSTSNLSDPFFVFLVLFFISYVFMPASAKYQIESFVGWLIKSPFIYVIDPLFSFVFKIPYVNKVVDFVLKRFPDDSILLFFNKKFESSTVSELNGDLAAVAENYFPQVVYPELWVKNIPDDIEKSLVVHGRLPNGALPANVLAPNALSGDLVVKAVKMGFVTAIFWFVVAFCFYSPNTLIQHRAQNAVSNNKLMDVSPFQTQKIPKPSLNQELIENRDFWSTDGWINALQAARQQSSVASVSHDKKEDKKTWEPSSDSEIKSALYKLNWNLNGFITCILFAVCTFFGHVVKTVNLAKSTRVAPISVKTKDSGGLYNTQHDVRENARAIYQNQIANTTEDTIENGFDFKQPKFKIGRATGTMHYRGALNAPMAGQDVVISFLDAARQTLVIGQTGSGKSELFVKPHIRAVAEFKRQAHKHGNKRYISMLALDGKGVIHKDVEKAAAAAGLLDHFVVIGTADNEYGFNLIGDSTPDEFADMISTAMEQAAKSGADNIFWDGLKRQCISEHGWLMLGFRHTPDGVAWANETGIDPYSPLGIYEAVMNPLVVERAIGGINDAVVKMRNGDKDGLAIKPFLTPNLNNAMTYLTSEAWLKMANETKDGIIQNVKMALGGLASDPGLSRKFASGSNERTLKVSDFWGKIVALRITRESNSFAGLVVQSFIKSMFFKHAKIRNFWDEKIGEKEKMFFIADEYQSLITNDEKSGLNDVEFWNQARSLGVYAYLTTQTVKSILNATGKTLENCSLLDQMSNVIALHTTDEITTKWLIEKAGQSKRAMVGDGQYETFEALVRDLHYDPIHSRPMKLVENSFAYTKAVFGGAFNFFHAGDYISKSNYVSDPYAVDPSLIKLANSEEGNGDYISLMNRQEDRLREFNEGGYTNEPLLTVADINSLGNTNAIVFYVRAGAIQFDIVNVRPSALHQRLFRKEQINQQAA